MGALPFTMFCFFRFFLFTFPEYQGGTILFPKKDLNLSHFE